MAISPLNSTFYADPSSLTALKREAASQSPEALRETAKQFESLFTTMMLKSMRDATPGDSLFGSDQQEFYQDMFDQQLSVQLSKGKGLGLADVLVRQLMQGLATGAPVVEPPQAANLPWPPQSRDEFVQAILPAAREAGQQLGVDPTSIIAQAALETGWGSSVPEGEDGRSSFNLFGIKSGPTWRGASTTAATSEFENGRMKAVDADFRAYESPAHSLRDYVSLLSTNPRYAAALGTGSDAAAFGTALQNAGYATDPLYARKLDAVARDLKSRLALPITAT
jgi:peptidoglycan hydrolase FlgJ